MKISIITSVKNGYNTLERCISSVQSQNGVDFEHIIVDGGSTDTSSSIYEKYKSKIVLCNLPGSSIYEAMNYGVSISSSNLLCFLNCDDYYADNNSLSRIIRVFNSNSELGLVYGNCNFVSTNNAIYYTLIPYSKFFFPLAKLRLFNISHPCWVIKKSIFKELNGYNTLYKYVSDTDFILRFLQTSHNYQYCNFSVVNFELSGFNASKSVLARIEWKELLYRYNGKSFFIYLAHIFLLIILFAKDHKYFIYKIKSYFKNLPIK